MALCGSRGSNFGVKLNQISDRFGLPKVGATDVSALRLPSAAPPQPSGARSGDSSWYESAYDDQTERLLGGHLAA